MINVEHARAHIDALTNGLSASATIEFRALHDKRKDLPGVPIMGTLDTCLAALEYYQAEQYGIFLVISETDGAGLHNENMRAVRANYADLDDVDATARYHQAVAWTPKPSFAVISSEGRAHMYWVSERHNDFATFGLIQRKLVTMFNSDPACIDPARVLRLAGSVNWKRETPVQTSFVPLGGGMVTVAQMEFALSGVVADAGGGDRIALGDATNVAPSLEWAQYALFKVDPSHLDRLEWLKLTAAFKASAWPHGGDMVARIVWDAWCAQYVSAEGKQNDPAENDKLWNDITETKTGWGHLVRTSGIAAELLLAGKSVTGSTAIAADGVGFSDGTPAPQPAFPMPGAVLAGETVAPILTGTAERFKPSSWLVNPQEQAQFFAGCRIVSNLGRILTPQGRLLDQQRFNMTYGGYEFAISADGKTTDEPWRAATRGKVFRLPMVDHLRFMPMEPHGALLVDEFGRDGVNTYQPARVRMVEGDASPFVNHLRRILPSELDVRILTSYLAHNVQRPGYKVPWAPLIQSTEGAGKGVIKMVMSHAVGNIYVHSPNAKELTEGGGKFNGWLAEKLLIICDEIRVDEKRDMIEVLKPMISEIRLEMQSKGMDQAVLDNPANWVFFTNYKDAVPVSKNGRRWAIMYSPMQSANDLIRAGMDGAYFKALYDWLRADGAAICAWYLAHYPIEAEFDPAGIAQRAPITSSWKEALLHSRSRIEQVVNDAIEGSEPGFRGGYISSVMLARRMAADGMRTASPAVLRKAIEEMGYTSLGRSPRAYMQESDTARAIIYVIDQSLNVDGYAKAQGYAI